MHPSRSDKVIKPRIASLAGSNTFSNLEFQVQTVSNARIPHHEMVPPAAQIQFRLVGKLSPATLNGGGQYWISNHAVTSSL